MNKDTPESELLTPEEQKLLLEIEAKKKENRWYIAKIILWLLSAIAIPLSALIITIKENKRLEIIYNNEVKLKEIIYNNEIKLKDKDFELRLMSFFLDNYEQFFDSDTLVASNIANVVAVLDTSYLKGLFEKIVEISSEQTKKIYKKKIEKIEKFESRQRNEIWFVIRKMGNNLPVQNEIFSLFIDKREYKTTTNEFGLAKITIQKEFDSELEYKITVQNKTFHRLLRDVVYIDIPNN